MTIKESIQSLKKLFHNAAERRAIKEQIKTEPTLSELLASLHELDEKQNANLFTYSCLNNPRSDIYLGHERTIRLHNDAMRKLHESSHALLNKMINILAYYDNQFPMVVHRDKKQAVGIHLERLKMLRRYKHTLKMLEPIFSSHSRLFISPWPESVFNRYLSQYQTETVALLARCELTPEYDTHRSTLSRITSFFIKNRTHDIDVEPTPIPNSLPTYDEHFYMAEPTQETTPHDYYP